MKTPEYLPKIALQALLCVWLGIASTPLRAQVYAEMLLSDKTRGHRPIQSLTVPGDVNVYDNLHHHGPAFENELVGYRIYFDHRQTVDLYGKRHPGLELAHTQFYPTPQDIADGYGDDILWAGTTVSVGSFRGYADGQPSFIQPVERRTEQILEYGPDRTVVEVRDEGWEYEGQRIDMVQRYTLEAGRRDVRVDITLTADTPIRAPFCTGVLTFPDGETFTDGEGLCASWGTNWAYGPKDTLNTDHRATLGVAVCIPNQYVLGEPDNKENLIYLIGARKARKTVTLTYWLAFCNDKEEWEGSMHSAEEWFAWVRLWKKQHCQ